MFAESLSLHPTAMIVLRNVFAYLISSSKISKNKRCCSLIYIRLVEILVKKGENS